MRSVAATFLGVLVAGLVALALTINGATPEQSLGVSVVQAVATLTPGGPEACEEPISLGEPVTGVTFNPGAPPPATPALLVTVRDTATRAALASGRIGAGFNPTLPQTVPLSRTVSTSRPVALCVRDLGPTPVGVFGAPSRATPCSLQRGSFGCAFGSAIATTTVSNAYLGSTLLPGQIAAVFHSAPRSLGDSLAATFDHASLFRPGFVGRGFWWALLAALLLGVPAALLWALRAVAGRSA